MTKNIQSMPLVALRGMVAFPKMRINFEAGRKKSIEALKYALTHSVPVFLTAQKDLHVEQPDKKELYSIGVTAYVKQILKNHENENFRVFVECDSRAKLVDLINTGDFYTADVIECEEKKVSLARRDAEIAAVRKAREIFGEYSAASFRISPDFLFSVIGENSAGVLADFIAGNIPLEYQTRQMILNELDPIKRLEKLCVILEKEIKILRIEDEIEDKVNEQMDKNQRLYYLREQMKVISEELSEEGEGEDEGINELRSAVKALKLPEESEKKLLKECSRLERASSQSPEGTVIRTYIETCLELPWNKMTKDKLDLVRARKILDNDHYGLKKVKDRIIETLAVRSLSEEQSGQILCLVGPPGVGKTSVAKSIAKAMGRKYVRISLGGVRDEAEIRGHRKTYIGSMPGRIMTAMGQAKVKNPLMLLDEVDKLGSDYRGDPSSALLEALDSEQNFAFRDHYIELPFDLSKVFFVTTANDMSTIPAPLLDRMDVIELGSYTHEEKFNIAKLHLVPKQVKKHGMSAKTIKFTDDALREIIDGYTREAGVRTLERKIADICRKAAVDIVNKTKAKIVVTPENLSEFLSARKYKNENNAHTDEVGVVNGLAWTSVGGEMLKTEVAVLNGTGKLELTGSLGDVMKESAKTAVSLLRSRTQVYGIENDFYKTKDIHIHFPEGAVPKDGPSAGCTIATALVSALTNRAVKGDVAMTGEITLRGKVLPIGGLREKTMAAYRAGMKTVIIPSENVPDLDEVDDAVKAAVDFTAVETIDEVFSAALCEMDGRKDKRDAMPVIPESMKINGATITQ